MLTHAFVLPSRTLGRFSMMSPSFDQTSTTIALEGMLLLKFQVICEYYEFQNHIHILV